MSEILAEEVEAPDTGEPDESAPVEPDAEPDEEEAAEEAPPEVAPEETTGLSEADLEKISKKLDGEATRHANRLSEIMGDTAQILVPCELCDRQTAGFHLPVEVLQPESDLDARLLEVLKQPESPAYREDPNTRECAVCGGLGQTLTRGQVAGKTLRVCKTCNGVGYVSMDGPDLAPTNGAVAEDVYGLPEDQPLVGGDVDIWQSPRLLPDGQENPNYGKMPQYKNPTLP